MSRPISELRDAIAEAIQPAHFFIGPELVLEWEHADREDVSWEVFQGRLLDASRTRQRRSFEAWNIYLQSADGRSAEPLLTVKLDADAGCVHVVRSIYSYAWEGYHAGDNVYLSREVRKWLRELVATIPLPTDRVALQTALAAGLFQAVVGLSRLPLSSIEAPLPSFSLGQLAYFFQPASTANSPMRSHVDLVGRAMTADRPRSQMAKLLEFLLRSTPADRLADAARRFASRWREIGQVRLPALFRTLFEEVSLSPYTDFVDRTLAFLRLLEEQGHLIVEEHVDFLSSLLRQLGRHLTAYDLVIFHHRGANYPDALLLNATLGAYLELMERHPALFARSVQDDETAGWAKELSKKKFGGTGVPPVWTGETPVPPIGSNSRTAPKRLRRRALRQAVLPRCQYQGHEVPDAPTSPGENLRVLPEPSIRVPDEQIVDPSKRRRRLFADDPLLERLSRTAKDLLRASIEDLEEPAELRELGLALFLDRPLGIFKRPTEPDQTLLLSYEAFSPSVAERRLRFLAEELGLISEPRFAVLRDRLGQGSVAKGIPLGPRLGPVRPGVVSLSDALQVAPDFILLRSTRRAIDSFLAQFDLPSLREHLDLGFLVSERHALIVGGASVAGQRPGTLLIYDGEFRLCLEFEIDEAAGLRVRRVGGQDLSGADVRLPARG